MLTSGKTAALRSLTPTEAQTLDWMEQPHTEMSKEVEIKPLSCLNFSVFFPVTPKRKLH